MSLFPLHVFREYDIRGIAGKEIDEGFAERLGMAFASLLASEQCAPVAVGMDARLSGPKLKLAVTRGLIKGGCDVWDLGMIPTPLTYFAVHRWHGAGCVMVTGSHNPPEYNGFKMMRGVHSLHSEAIAQLRKAMENVKEAPKQGRIQHRNIKREYCAFVEKDIRLHRPLRIVIDAGNGPAGAIASPLYRALGCEVIELYCEPDGRFPNHHPDPTVDTNLQDLIQTVTTNRADLGLAFDGDGDRLGVVDEQGRIIRGDMLLLILARDVLRRHPGATIISEVKSSRHLYNGIKALGGRALMARTGHSPIKAKMKETGALIAGEMSGHVFFADRYYGFDDAIYAGARLLEIVAAHDGSLSSLLSDVPKSYSTPEIRIDCPDETKFRIVEDAKRHFSSLGCQIVDVDGVRLEFDDGWGLIRASNTQPSLVLRFEADTKQRLDWLRHMVEDWLNARLAED